MCHFLLRKALWMRKASLDIPKWTNKYAWKLLSPREPSLPLFLNCFLTVKNERVTVQLRVSASNFRPAAINWKRSSLPYTCKWSQKFSGGFLPWDTDPILHLDGNVILVRHSKAHLHSPESSVETGLPSGYYFYKEDKGKLRFFFDVWDPFYTVHYRIMLSSL